MKGLVIKGMHMHFVVLKFKILFRMKIKTVGSGIARYVVESIRKWKHLDCIVLNFRLRLQIYYL